MRQHPLPKNPWCTIPAMALHCGFSPRASPSWDIGSRPPKSFSSFSSLSRNSRYRRCVPVSCTWMSVSGAGCPVACASQDCLNSCSERSFRKIDIDRYFRYCAGFSDAGMTMLSNALWRPASEKRQGTKSRDVGGNRAAGAMGIWPRSLACGAWAQAVAAIGLPPGIGGASV